MSQSITDQEDASPNNSNPPNRVIVIGASAGGFDALKQIIGDLPSDFSIPIFLVWHISPDVRGVLPAVLNRMNSIHAAHGQNNELIENKRIYIAPPDHHLLIDQNRVRITHGPKENRFRPAVDPLFRSAALAYGPGVIGIILSGALDDGTAGLWAVKNHGGITIVQDPATAEVPSMPENAIREVKPNYIVSVSEMAALLVKLSDTILIENSNGVQDKKTQVEMNIAEEKHPLKEGVLALGEFSAFTCPECHGVLTKIMDGNIARFRCHTGHAFSTDALLKSITENIEDSLYSAIRGMDESVMLLNHIGDHLSELNQLALAAAYFLKAKESDERSQLVRQAVQKHEPLSNEELVEFARKNDAEPINS